MIKNILVIPFLLAASFLSNASTQVPNTPNNTAPNDGVSSTISANWAGYVADTSTYSAVGGTWSVPTPGASNALSTDATWVGIGGVKSKDLIQAGTQALVEDGDIQYQAWYELLPGSQHIVPLPVHGGDTVTVSLTEISTDLWRLSFHDATTGQDYQTNLSYHSSLSSAEWIEEMPVITGGRGASYIPLDSFGTVNFSGGYTIANGTGETIAGAGATALTMASRAGERLATPSALAGDSFSITRSSASAAVARSTFTTQNTPAPTVTRAYRGGGGRHVTFYITFGR